jgi:hypothetical protein
MPAPVPMARRASVAAAALTDGLSAPATLAPVTEPSSGVRASERRASAPEAACSAPVPRVRRVPSVAGPSVTSAGLMAAHPVPLS